MSEVIFYTTEDGLTKINVQLENENVWLTQKEMVEVYQTTKSIVSVYIKNIFAEEELFPEATVRKIRTVSTEGNREVACELDYHNLDMIITLGYRVNSKVAIRFHQWVTEAKERATKEYKKYKAKTLSGVETEYLKTIGVLEKQAKKGDKLSKAKGTNNKGGKA